VPKTRIKNQKKSQNNRLLVLTLTLTVLGLIALADASAPIALSTFNDKFYFVKQQVVWGLIGIVLMFVFSKVSYTFWEKIATPIFFFSLLLLALVLFPGFGARALGARRWLFLGPISFQPSEFTKLALAIYFAKLTSKGKNVLSYLVPLGIVAALIMLQPDLGTMISIAIIAMSQVFISGINLLYFIISSVGAGLVGLVLILISDYRRQRLLTYLARSQDPLGKDYHIRQILLGLGSGGMFGVGLGASRQKYLFLPEAATDSIFAVVAEEVGFVGAVLIIGVFLFFIIEGLKIAKSAPDTFSRSLSVGLVAWIGGQTFLNIASMVALVPLTGIPLPFFSYGGSSLTSVLVAVGILLNISKHEQR